MQELEHLLPVKRGHWLYDGSIPCEVRVVRHHFLFGTGDVDDGPDLSQDRGVECFYVLYQTPVGSPRWVGGGSALSLDEAVAIAEAKLSGGVDWDATNGYPVAQADDSSDRRSSSKLVVMKTRPSAMTVPDLWEVDGSLRDMYVFNMSIDDWSKFLSVASLRSLTYSFDGEAQSLPSVERIFAERGGSHLLAIQVGSIAVNCHFFVVSELELDIDPREVCGALQHAQLLEFAEAIASALQKPIFVTPENTPESPLLSFDPSASEWQVHT